MHYEALNFLAPEVSNNTSHIATAQCASGKEEMGMEEAEARAKQQQQQHAISHPYACLAGVFS
eukprot:1158084-Pelagomonas_calceolata.AAC.16